MFLSVIIGLAGMLTPYVSKLLIDNAYPSRDVSLMQLLVVGVAVMTIASSAMSAIQGYFSQSVNVRLGSATTLMFFNHVQHLPAAFFDEHRVGEVMSRFQDLRSALNLVSTGFQTILSGGVYILLVPPFLLLLNWKLAVLSVIVVPITVTISTVSSRIVRKFYRENAEASAGLNAYQYEVFSHIRTLKSMAIESHVYARAEREMYHVIDTQLKAGRMGSAVGLVNGVIKALGAGLFTWYAWTLILRQELSLGSFIAFTAYLGYLTGPLNQLALLFSNFQQAAVSLGRMFEYLDTPVEQDPIQAYVPALPIRQKIVGVVEFRNVSFAYDASRRVLHDISFTALPGQLTAIVGPSGAGKSSLLRLVSRMADPVDGLVLIDQTPVCNLELQDVRRQVAAVWQEFSVMRGTVWDNLTFGMPDASRKLVDDIVSICRLDEMIAALPDGYETPVAEWGASLSGGQRQRMAIARALVRDTPILLLDEPTANIDVQTEEDILRDLFARFQDKTVLFVTHRVATAKHADQVCVIQDGRLVAVGSPARIAEMGDTYRELADITVSPRGDVRRLRVVPVTS